MVDLKVVQRDALKADQWDTRKVLCHSNCFLL